MKDQEAKDFVDKIFEQLKEVTTIEEVDSLLNSQEILKKNTLSAVNYPAIKFQISEDEIKELKKAGHLTKENTFSANLTSAPSDPITKLLYAIAWKNGDLQKVKHIVEGILDCQNPTDEREDGLVFHQFGKFLSGTPHEPIIDQHVLRAFAVHQAKSPEQVRIARKLSTISKRNKELIKDYKYWVKHGPKLQESLRSMAGYTYHLDKLLFAVGKTVKLNKRSLKLA